MDQKITSWKASQIVSEATIPIYEEIISSADAPTDTSKTVDGTWIISAFFDVSVSHRFIQNLFSTANNLANEISPDLKIEPVYEQDWKKNMQTEFKSLEIGSFFIHHYNEVSPKDLISLHVPAGQAFGTGEHPTTAACLTMYEEIMAKRNGKKFINGLDMGCGSAILAMAVAKKDSTSFIGIDIDEPSIITANENVEDNQLTDYVKCYVGDGFKAQEAINNAPYGLIFANILANPVIEMASNLTSSLENNGIAILSGFLEEQQNDVVKAYTDCGLKVITDCKIGEWMSVALAK